MTANLDEMVERWRVAARHAVELEHEADKAEARRKAIKAELMNHAQFSSMAAKELAAENDPRYHEAVRNSIDERTRFNLQRVEAEARRMAFEAARTISANERAERQMHR